MNADHTLDEFCAALGWSRVPIADALAEVKRLKARETELLREAGEKENERRSAVNRSESSYKLLHALCNLMEQRFNNEELGVMKLIAEVSRRADMLERDAWCGAVNVASDFVKATNEVISTNNGVQADICNIQYWCARFKAVLERSSSKP